MSKIHTMLIIVVSGLVALSGCKKKDDSPRTDLSASWPKDITLAEDIEVPNETQHYVIKIKGEKARTDMDGMSLIQSASNGSFFLNHQTKTYGELPQIFNTNVSKDEAVKFTNGFVMKFTGKKDTIAGWRCREFLVYDQSGDDVSGGVRQVAWIADDFPEGRDIQRLLMRINPNQMASIEKETGMNLAMPGFALRTEFYQGGRQTQKITYTLIKQGAIPESDFEAPKDYQRGLNESSTDVSNLKPVNGAFGYVLGAKGQTVLGEHVEYMSPFTIVTVDVTPDGKICQITGMGSDENDSYNTKKRLIAVLSEKYGLRKTDAGTLQVGDENYFFGTSNRIAHLSITHKTGGDDFEVEYYDKQLMEIFYKAMNDDQKAEDIKKKAALSNRL